LLLATDARIRPYWMVAPPHDLREVVDIASSVQVKTNFHSHPKNVISFHVS
jgi:hypothetical protein